MKKCVHSKGTCERDKEIKQSRKMCKSKKKMDIDREKDGEREKSTCKTASEGVSARRRENRREGADNRGVEPGG